jgi:uncharacterized protein (TIGR03000 family)
MRRLLLLAAVAAGGVLGSAREAGAFHGQVCGPPATSVTWPCVTPPGWYTNTYRHAWYYPWYAYYDFSHGPYANWMAGGGYATYSWCGPGGHFHWTDRVPAQPWTGEGSPYAASLRPGQAQPAPKEAPKDKETPKETPQDDERPKELPKVDETSAGVSITLPADAKLFFNGAEATGTGGVRAFLTPPLQVGQSYQYLLTAEVVRDGRTERVTEAVVVRAGETARVTLTPGVATAGK